LYHSLNTGRSPLPEACSPQASRTTKKQKRENLWRIYIQRLDESISRFENSARSRMSIKMPERGRDAVTWEIGDDSLTIHIFCVLFVYYKEH